MSHFKSPQTASFTWGHQKYPASTNTAALSSRNISDMSCAMPSFPRGIQVTWVFQEQLEKRYGFMLSLFKLAIGTNETPGWCQTFVTVSINNWNYLIFNHLFLKLFSILSFLQPSSYFSFLSNLLPQYLSSSTSSPKPFHLQVTGLPHVSHHRGFVF